MTVAKAARLSATLLGAAALLPAALRAQSGSATVLGTANIYAAGGNGPTSPGGGGSGTAPNLVALLAGTGRTLSFGAVAGAWGCGPAFNGPDGGSCAGATTNILASGSISGIRTDSRNMFLVGVFLGNSLPGSAPATSTYTTADLGLASFGAPQLGQVFFIGDGLTGSGSGAIQSFAVPDAATRLYLGVADAFAFGSDVGGGRDPGYYDDNMGSVTARYAISATSTVPEPTSLALAAAGGAVMLGWGARRRRAG